MDSIQDFHRFSDRIMDIVSDYIRFSDWIDPNDGIYVDDNDEVSLLNRNDISDVDNFYPISNLLVKEGGKEWVSIDHIDDITAKYIFVR